MEPENYDWTQFELVFYYDQSVEEVFLAWATGNGLESFFIAKADFTSSLETKRNELYKIFSVLPQAFFEIRFI